MNNQTIATLPRAHFLALAKTFASLSRADDCRDSVEEGDEIDICGTLDYSMLMTVGKDNPNSVIAMSVPVWDILAAALGRLNGVTVEALVKEVADQKVASDLKALKKSAKDALTSIKGKHTGMKLGPVKVKDMMVNE